MTGKDYLSQEEIDALLRQTNDESSDLFTANKSDVDDFLSPLEQDALGEIGNITFGSAATALSTLLGKKVEITTPQVSIIMSEDLVNEFPQPHVAVHVNYVEGFNGMNLLVIKSDDAQVIADLMMGGDGRPHVTELSELHISAVQEAMNQMMGSSATSMSTIFNRFINISPPGIDILDLTNGDGNLPSDDVLIKVSFRLTIGDLIDSNIMQLLPLHFAKEMITSLLGESTSEAAATTASPSSLAAEEVHAPYVAPTNHVQETPITPPAAAYGTHGGQQIPPQMPDYSQMGMQPNYGAPMYQQPMYQQPTQLPPQAPAAYGGVHNRNVNVQPVQFSNLPQGSYPNVDETNLNLLLDIPLKVTVELGRTNKEIKDILELSQGSIIELDKLAGEPVDIMVNNKLIAKGEVVVIDENFGVRVTDIVSQWDRIQKIK